MFRINKKHPVRTFGDRVLREHAEAVPAVDDDIRSLAETMLMAMRKYDGIGIAAPQVGESLRLVVFDVPFPEDPCELTPGEAALLPRMPLAVVNPEIVGASDALAERDEGCLSVPGIFAPVVRPERVRFRAQLLDGTTVEYECGGLLGRCIQHELDHLEGVLFTDRVSPAEQLKIREQLERLEANGARNNYRR